jgi:phenylacetate-CoA ligase
MMRRLADRLWGNLVVVSNLPRQRRVPYLHEAELEARRDARIRETIMYAAETVPYYRELFAREGIDPREIVSAAELEQLPLTPKEAVRKEPDRFVSQSRRGRESIAFHTSGATGIPIRFHHDRRSLLQNIAFGERQRHVEVRLVGREIRYLKVSLVRAGGTGAQVRSVYRSSTFIPVKPRRRSVESTQPLDRIIEEINKLRPDVIRGNGSEVELLVRHVAATGTRMHLPRVFIYGSDMMTQEAKDLIEHELGVPLLSHYNATEAFQIGYLCEERRDFHLQMDLCHLMVVTADGTKATPRERGEVVITNLVNRGTVLLNYRLGDVAARLEERCSCGRTFPLLSQLEGRVEDVIYLEDGRIVLPRLVWDVVKKHPGVAQYQLVQLEPRSFELRLVVEDGVRFGGLAEPLVNDLRQLLWGAEVEATQHAALEPGPGGKFRAVVALVKPEPHVV